MRKTLFLLCASLLTICTSVEFLFAQTEKLDKQERKERRELLMSLQNEKEINVIIDISQAVIHGMSEADFVYRENLTSDEDWATLWENEYKPDLFLDLLKVANLYIFDNGYKVRLGDYENSKYQIRLVVTSIAANGTTNIDVYIENTEQQNVLCKFYIVGTGGMIGPKVNLMGDGFKRAGKELAKQTIKLFKTGRATYEAESTTGFRDAYYK